jgi:hypothetical protein
LEHVSLLLIVCAEKQAADFVAAKAPKAVFAILQDSSRPELHENALKIVNNLLLLIPGKL